MKGLRKIIEGFSKSAKYSSKMKTIFPEPSKTRKYEEIKDKMPFDQASPTMVLPQMENFKPDEDLVYLDILEKEVILCLMEYYEYLDAFTSEFQDKQDFIQKCNDLHMMVSEDRPVKFETLLELCPELYVYETLERESPIPLESLYKNLGLPSEEKQKVIAAESENKKSGSELSIHETSEYEPYRLTPPSQPMPEEPLPRIKDYILWDPEDPNLRDFHAFAHFNPYELRRRAYYIYEQTKKQYIESADFLDELKDKLGTYEAVLTYLQLKGDSCTAEEKKILNGLDYVERLMKEQHEFTKSAFDFYTSNVILPFPMPEWLRTKFIKTLEDIVTNREIENLPEAIGIPDNYEEMRKEIELKEQKARDFMILEEKEREKAKKLLIKGDSDVITRRDLSAKDESLIRKVTFLSETLNIKKPLEPVADFSEVFSHEDLRLKLNKESIDAMKIEAMHLENLIKVYYLNSADPQKYNLEFWGENLNISTKRLKNIFYNFSFPVIIDGKVEGKISFVDIPKKKDIYDLYQDSLRKEFQKEKNT